MAGRIDISANLGVSQSKLRTAEVSERRRIAIICDDAHAGGTFVMGATLAQGLQSSVQDVAFVAPDTAVTREAAKTFGVAVHALPQDLYTHPAAHLQHVRFAQWLSEAEFDGVVFCNSNTAATVAGKVAARVLGIPFYTWLHLVEPDEAALFRPFTARAVEAMDLGQRIVCVSQANAVLFNEQHTVCDAPVGYVHNGVASHFERPVDQARVQSIRHDLGLASGDVLVFSPSRMEHRKGTDRLIAAFGALVHNTDQNVRLLICGGDPTGYGAQVMNGVPEKVREGIIRRDHQDDVVDYYDAADLVFLPSRREGLPLVVLEALARGRAVLACDVGGVGEALGDGAGHLVSNTLDEGRTLAALSEALMTLVANRDQRLALGERAAQHFAKHFRASRMVGEHLALIEALPLPAAAFGAITLVQRAQLVRREVVARSAYWGGRIGARLSREIERLRS